MARVRPIPERGNEYCVPEFRPRRFGALPSLSPPPNRHSERRTAGSRPQSRNLAISVHRDPSISLGVTKSTGREKKTRGGPRRSVGVRARPKTAPPASGRPAFLTSCIPERGSLSTD